MKCGHNKNRLKFSLGPITRRTGALRVSIQEALIFASLKVVLEGKGSFATVMTSGMARVFIPTRPNHKKLNTKPKQPLPLTKQKLRLKANK